MTDLTHERCSEQLDAYASGTLSAPEQSEVEVHLRSCAECSQELRGLRALRGTEVTPMTGYEREALGTAVRAAVLAPAKPRFSERFGRRLAPALGAVALLVLGVVTFVSVSDDGPLPAAQQGADDAEVETLEDSYDSEAAAPAPRADAKKAGGVAGGSGTAEDYASDTESSADVTSAAGTGSQSSTLRAPTGLEIKNASFAEVGLDLGSLVPNRLPARTAVDALALSAPDRRLAGMVRDCSELTVSTSPYPLIPSSAAYYQDDVLVIGFVWLEQTTEILNYELRGWIGGRCDRVTPIYRRGLIE